MHAELCKAVPMGGDKQESKDRAVVWLWKQPFEGRYGALNSSIN